MVGGDGRYQSRQPQGDDFEAPLSPLVTVPHAFRRREEYVYVPYSHQLLLQHPLLHQQPTGLIPSQTRATNFSRTQVTAGSRKHSMDLRNHSRMLRALLYGSTTVALFVWLTLLCSHDLASSLSLLQCWSPSLEEFIPCPNTWNQRQLGLTKSRRSNHPTDAVHSHMSATQIARETSKKQTRASPVVFAFDERGEPGYVADPKALQKAVRKIQDDFWVQRNLTKSLAWRDSTSIQDADLKEEEPIARAFWTALQTVGVQAREGTRTAHIPLTHETVCALGPGQGMEDEGGYKLLAEKIQLVAENQHNNNGTNPSLLCAIYSHQGMFDLARTAALTWGSHCDGFLIFGNGPTIPELGLLHLPHEGDESYDNMWQKVRAIWTYVHDHYVDQFDFFHLGGDDMYVLAPNLRFHLARLETQFPNQPIFTGQHVPLHGGKDSSFYVTGGPGYSLNRLALQQLVQQSLPTCHVHQRASYEDRLVTECLRRIGIEALDSRDSETGEQVYHGVAPHTLYTSRVNNDGGAKSFHHKALQYWSQQPHSSSSGGVVGPKPELHAAARLSVSFHNLYHPLYMARVHTILYPSLCR